MFSGHHPCHLGRKALCLQENRCFSLHVDCPLQKQPYNRKEHQIALHLRTEDEPPPRLIQTPETDPHVKTAYLSLTQSDDKAYGLCSVNSGEAGTRLQEACSQGRR